MEQEKGSGCQEITFLIALAVCDEPLWLAPLLPLLSESFAVCEARTVFEGPPLFLSMLLVVHAVRMESKESAP